MSLVEAAARADELAQSGSERELATLRKEWEDELESAARSSDYRERAAAYRAIGQFRFRQKLELLRRGLDDESPAARGSALLSAQLLSKDSPGVVNAIRPVLHTIVTTDANAVVAEIHDRMPVILPKEAEEAWLHGEAGEARKLLMPYAGPVNLRAVSRHVSNVNNEGPECLDDAESQWGSQQSLL